MKKILLTVAIVLGLSMTALAAFDNNHNGGLFGRGLEPREKIFQGNRDNTPMLPLAHGLEDHQDSGETAPLGSGIAVLLGLGAAYLVGKKHNKE
ncbi:MAG: hypothetical protein IKX56_08030 [Muribaculaceae bacterium]|nr:hypothetical protein [Muribaculaceae bacterium]